MYTYEYEITEGEYYDFNLYHIRNAPSMRAKMRRERLGAPVLYMATAGVVGFSLGNYWEIYALAGALSVLWLLFYGKIIEHSLRKNIARMKADGKLPYSVKGTLIFDEEKLIDRGVTSETTVHYGSFTKLCAGKSAYYLYFSAAQGIIVPFSAVPSDAEREQLYQFLRRNIPLADG